MSRRDTGHAGEVLVVWEADGRMQVVFISGLAIE